MRSLLCTTAFLLGSALLAQPFNWQWATAVPGGYGVPPGMANDGAGNTYLAGQFGFSITFAPLAPLTNTDINDGYIVKYDDQGMAVWALQLHGSGTDICRALSVDAAGNVYVTGEFNSPSLTIGGLTLNGFGYENIFVVKVSTDGEPLWARNLSDASGEFESGRAIATTPQGESYVTGRYQGTMAVDGVPTLTSCSNNANMFLMKMDTDGNVIWNQAPICPSQVAGTSSQGDKLALAPAGDLYVAGRYQADSCTVGDTVLVNSSPGSSDMLFARYNADGDQVWVHGIGGVNEDQIRALTTDAQGNCYLGINRNDDTVVPELTVGITGSIGPYDVAILKCDPDGHFLLGERIGNSTADQTIFSLTAMPDGTFYAAGSYQRDCVIDGFYFPFIDYPYYFCGFLVRYSPAGVAQQVLVFQDEVPRVVQALSHDDATNLYMAGCFEDTITIGTTPILDLPYSGLFLARSGDFNTAVAGDTNDPDVRAYPTPTNGPLRVDALLPFDRIEVYDVDGRIVLDRRSAPTRSMDLVLDQRGTLLYTLWHNGRIRGKGRIVNAP